MVTLEHRYSIGFKRLVEGEVVASVSNQHEFNGVAALRNVLGIERREWSELEWVLLQDHGDHVTETHRMTWYDAREQHPSRSEWRLYYGGQTSAQPGDLLVIVRRDDGELGVAVAAAGSTWESQIEQVLGGSKAAEQGFVEGSVGELTRAFVGAFADFVGAFGWKEQAEADISVDIVEEAFTAFGGTFPKTHALSTFVRERTRYDSDADTQLEEWWSIEDSLFKGLERRVIESRIAVGFNDVSDFLAFSLEVQNRRKARAGRALENHLEALFQRSEIQFERNARTEGNRSPDFLFPGRAAYRDAGFPADGLRMLAAKTTCKERWRQILSEAARIPVKHLCTLEPAISTNQLIEMSEERVTIVAPTNVLNTYNAPSWVVVLGVSEFIKMIRALQARTA